MTSDLPSGTEGYAAHASGLFVRYEARDPEVVHAPVLSFFPPSAQAGGRTAIDIGAGTGRDAAWLASRGMRVLAVEPTPEMREPAIALHPSPRIEWLDDSLPRLERARELGRTFDVVLLNAVWMHLDEAQRAEAMPRVAALTHGGSRVFLSLRHGPVPKGRRMFEVTGDETAALAETCGLTLLFHETRGSVDAQNRAAGVRWTRLVFER